MNKLLENISVDLFTQVKNNGMQANADKCHLLVNSKDQMCAKIEPCDIQSSAQQMLLRDLTDNKLTFDKHITYLCTKANQKLNALCHGS